jgi:phenylpropionate dioxygenase-like ring-hydroxylating dioxygenase large terminal subunit
LAPARTQLPVGWYFDPRIWEVEKRLLFDAGPGYVGHELMVPEPGDYHSLGWDGHARALVRDTGGIHLLSNVCRHRQATMLKGRGKTQSIVCPLHRWTYALDGRLLGAPKFAETPCLDLGRTALQRWNGLLFDGGRDPALDLAGLPGAENLDFTGYLYDHTLVEDYDCNWKTFIEVYLEDYHVVPFHPGLGHFVDCDTLSWRFGDRYSVQVVGIHDGLRRAGSEVYRRWHEQVLRYDGGRLPEHGAIWLTYYPNLMIEWYPHSLVVSFVVPLGAQRCRNVVEFYYPEDIALFEREYVDAERAAYLETALEDREICERMTEGRHALWRSGRDDAGPYHSPYEDGMQHFHEYLRRELDHAL